MSNNYCLNITFTLSFKIKRGRYARMTEERDHTHLHTLMICTLTCQYVTCIHNVQVMGVNPGGGGGGGGMGGGWGIYTPTFWPGGRDGP